MIEILAAAIIAHGSINSSTPPAKYQGNTAAVVVTVDNVNTRANCGLPPPGYVFEGCEFEKNGVPIIIVPNACQYDYEFYGHLLCHEFGHVNGWNDTHDN